MCDFAFMSIRYVKSELVVKCPKDKVNTDKYSPNGEWELGNNVCHKFEYSHLVPFTGFLCQITIERRPAFVMSHIGLPLMCLSLLTRMVFWVPVDCVERISLSVTLFLALSVLVSTFTQKIPRNSIQLPLYMLIFLTAVNSASVGPSIIVVRLSLKNDTRVPDPVCKLVTGCSRSNLARIFPREKSARNTVRQKRLQEACLKIQKLIYLGLKLLVLSTVSRFGW